MGGTWATVMAITPAAVCKWAEPLSLWTICGTKAIVGANGVPNTDSAKKDTTGKCL